MVDRLYIKNMVCPRCIKVVKSVLTELGVGYEDVQLGEVLLTTDLDKAQKEQLADRLKQEGFALLTAKNAQLVERIKHLIISYVHDPEAHPDARNINFSQYLAQSLGQEYTGMSQLFSEVAGITIEKYLIAQKIARVKELLKYGELNLTQIADATGYSSVQYLSNQFKRVTGLSPLKFKQLSPPRLGIDNP